MVEYEYRVVCAPERSVRFRGIGGSRQAFAETFAHILNEEGRSGWSYLRTDTVSERVGRWPLRRRTRTRQLIVFRREKPVTARLAPPRPDVTGQVKARRVRRPDLVQFVRAGGRRVEPAPETPLVTAAE